MAFKLTHTLGIWGEQTALRLYLNNGYKLIAQNVCNSRGKRFGEIDIIVRKKKLLVFVEVKTRYSEGGINGAEAVNVAKQKKLLKIVQWFLMTYPQFQVLQPRIDVCLIVASKLDSSLKSVIIIPNAVETD